VSTSTTTDRPGLIQARPVRHPWRWVAIAVIALLSAMLANLIFTNTAFDWSFVFNAMVQTPVLHGLYIGTLLVTAFSMIVGVLGGVLTAVMRLSDNPILSGVAWVFTWFFRGIPRFVLLSTMGTLGILFQKGLGLGIPFDWKIQELLGISGSWRFATLDANALFAGLFGAVLGLGLSEAAYMSEIARAGILSVDTGQAEAAEALGMSSGKTMRRIVLPQAMRVIVPPTGNETIAMVKDTSLLIALPLINEMFFQLSSIGSRTYKVFPSFVAASIWYLIVTSILMVGQFYLERYFGRGFGEKKPKNKRFARAPGMGGA
jgi:polar amino acid transport system permease protein